MTYSEFRKHRFSGGMGFKLYKDDYIYPLALCDFSNGDCDTPRGDTYAISEIESFCYLDGTVVKIKP